MEKHAYLSSDRYHLDKNLTSDFLIFNLSFTGPTTVTTTDRICYLSVGRAFDGVEIKIDDPDNEGQGEVRHVAMVIGVWVWIHG